MISSRWKLVHQDTGEKQDEKQFKKRKYAITISVNFDFFLDHERIFFFNSVEKNIKRPEIITEHL